MSGLIPTSRTPSPSQSSIEQAQEERDFGTHRKVSMSEEPASERFTRTAGTGEQKSGAPQPVSPPRPRLSGPQRTILLFLLQNGPSIIYTAARHVRMGYTHADTPYVAIPPKTLSGLEDRCLIARDEGENQPGRGRYRANMDHRAVQILAQQHREALGTTSL